MDFVTYLNRHKWLVSFITCLFLTYPNIVCLPWELKILSTKEQHIAFFIFFIFKFAFFCITFRYIINYNIKKIPACSLKTRFLKTFTLTAAAYIILLTSYFIFRNYGIHDCWGSILIFQFFVCCCICVLIGHIIMLHNSQLEKENQIEKLKIENLQSRCTALTNQINPHYFFNSLNGITSLIRKNDNAKTIKYVEELADIFRYILQSGNKGMVTLKEEIDFITAYKNVMEVRFANKLSFNISLNNINTQSYTLPVLSMLPIIENVVVHNIIDSDHKMEISIYINNENELIISNPIYKKPNRPDSNGTGLLNLNNRYNILTGLSIKTLNDNNTFTVILPLK